MDTSSCQRQHFALAMTWMRSTTGAAMVFGHCLLEATSKTQSLQALSTAEAEFHTHQDSSTLDATRWYHQSVGMSCRCSGRYWDCKPPRLRQATSPRGKVVLGPGRNRSAYEVLPCSTNARPLSALESQCWWKHTTTRMRESGAVNKFRGGSFSEDWLYWSKLRYSVASLRRSILHTAVATSTVKKHSTAHRGNPSSNDDWSGGEHECSVNYP